jgi:hypothetical protein
MTRSLDRLCLEPTTRYGFSCIIKTADTEDAAELSRGIFVNYTTLSSLDSDWLYCSIQNFSCYQNNPYRRSSSIFYTYISKPQEILGRHCWDPVVLSRISCIIGIIHSGDTVQFFGHIFVNYDKNRIHSTTSVMCANVNFFDQRSNVYRRQ